MPQANHRRSRDPRIGIAQLLLVELRVTQQFRARHAQSCRPLHVYQSQTRESGRFVHTAIFRSNSGALARPSLEDRDEHDDGEGSHGMPPCPSARSKARPPAGCRNSKERAGRCQLEGAALASTTKVAPSGLNSRGHHRFCSCISRSTATIPDRTVCLFICRGAQLAIASSSTC